MSELSKKEEEVIRVLRAAFPVKEMYGIDIYIASPKVLDLSNVYLLLGSLQDRGYLASRLCEKTSPTAIPRRLWRLTDKGTRVRLGVKRTLLSFLPSFLRPAQ